MPNLPQKNNETVVIHYFTAQDEYEVDRYFASVSDAARWLLTPVAEATFAAVNGITRIEIAILNDDGEYPGR